MTAHHQRQNNEQQAKDKPPNKALHPTAYSPALVPRYGLSAAGELGRYLACAQRLGYSYFMFPTRSKTKISSSLAYPVNAKLISEALADVPQAQHLSISFFYWQSTARMHECSETYPVMAVEYSYRKASQYTPHYFEEAGMNEPNWSIWVQPVPSAIKHHVKELLQREALPKLHDWLLAKQNLTGKQETQSLTVWYDEAKNELGYGEHRHP